MFENFVVGCNGKCWVQKIYIKGGVWQGGGVLFFLRCVLFVQEYLVVTRMINNVGVAEL